MSIWSKFISSISGNGATSANEEVFRDSSKYAVVDCEVGLNDMRVHDIGALRWDGSTFHSANKHALIKFLNDVDFLCGHNIIHHDAKYLFGEELQKWALVDTLYVSPLLFPERPYHRLLKDDKLMSEQMNNPVNDSEKARDLLMEEVSAWNELSDRKQIIYATLLYNVTEFSGFLEFVGAKADDIKLLPELIREEYKGKICEHADVATIMAQQPVELAYALALVDTTDYRSVTPSWVLKNYPNVEKCVRLLRHTRCKEGCSYCNKELDVHYNLKQFFGYNQFRTYDGEPLQENAARAAVEGKSLLAIFPTGGGKSLTFQLPALMEARSVHGLTVVISPLQSLMKDQVDNLAERGITDAVTINGLLDSITRSL